MIDNCYFCDVPMGDVDAAIDAGWIPGFWDGDSNIPYPVCPSCQQVHIGQDETGEDVLLRTNLEEVKAFLFDSPSLTINVPDSWLEEK